MYEQSGRKRRATANAANYASHQQEAEPFPPSPQYRTPAYSSAEKRPQKRAADGPQCVDANAYRLQSSRPRQAGSRARNSRRKVTLLIAALLGTAYSVYIVSYFVSATATGQSAAEVVGGAIATALVAPHMILVLLASVFAWLGWSLRIAGLALTSGILFCVGGFLFIAYFPFVLLQMVLAFVGFGQTRKDRR